MREVKLFTVALLGLMVLAYLSWTKKDDEAKDAKVTLLSAKAEAIERIQFFTKTSTVELSYREAAGEKFAWFEVKSSRSTRRFTAASKVDSLLEAFAPLHALRSLGKDLSKEGLALTGLDEPQQKLVVTVFGKDKSFDVGERTGGARDFYVRPQSSKAVFLVASKTLSDLQFPEGKFMQRQLRNAPRTEVAKVSVTVGELSATALQRNRQSAKDAFWATEEKPEEKVDALGNYLDKLEKLTAVEYLADEAVFEKAQSLLEAVWFSEDGEQLGRIDLRKSGEGKSATYYAVSAATKVPVKVSRFTAEHLVEDAPAALAER